MHTCKSQHESSWRLLPHARPGTTLRPLWASVDDGDALALRNVQHGLLRRGELGVTVVARVLGQLLEVQQPDVTLQVAFRRRQLVALDAVPLLVRLLVDEAVDLL